MHLSVRMQAQERAAMLVQAWAEKANIQIGEVRYHLLRNALIFQDIHLKLGADKVTIEHILLRTKPELLNDPISQIGKMEISGIEAELHLSKNNTAWQQNHALMKLWKASSSITAQHGQVKLYFQEHGTTPLVTNNISIQQQAQSNKHIITASANTHHGSVQWKQTINFDDNTSNGELNWQHVNTLPLADAMQLKPIAGYLSGELKWQNSFITTTPQSPVQLQSALIFHPENSQPDKIDNANKAPPLTSTKIRCHTKTG